MRIISGSARGCKLLSPKGNNIRPTIDWVKEALFNILGHRTENSSFLDLCAGSGNVGLEALSRGAHATFVEKNSVAIALLKSNIEKCNFKDNFQVVASDAIRFVNYIAKATPAPAFDFIFADPPYASPLADKLLSALSPQNLHENGWLIIEHGAARQPACAAECAWKQERNACYGETVLSFYRPNTSV